MAGIREEISAIAARVSKAFTIDSYYSWDEQHRWETSWLLEPSVLFICRFILALYCLTTSVFILAWDCSHAANRCIASQERFSYFTVLTYWGMGFYFLAAAFHTGIFALNGRPYLTRWPRFLMALHSFLYTTIAVYPFIVTIVYWSLLYKGPWFPVTFDAWSNISQHMINSFFALFEVIIPRTNPPPRIHMFWLIFILALYLCLAYLTKATRGFYVYNFLDPTIHHGSVAGYVFGIALGSMVVFSLAYLVILVRKWLTERRLEMNGKFGRHPPPPADRGEDQGDELQDQPQAPNLVHPASHEEQDVEAHQQPLQPVVRK